MEVGRRWHWQRTPHCWAHSCPVPPSRCQAELCSEVLGGASGGPMSSSPRLTCPVLGPAPPACAPGDRPRPPLGLACGGRSEHVHRKGHEVVSPVAARGHVGAHGPACALLPRPSRPSAPCPGSGSSFPAPAVQGLCHQPFPGKTGKTHFRGHVARVKSSQQGETFFLFLLFYFIGPAQDARRSVTSLREPRTALCANRREAWPTPHGAAVTRVPVNGREAGALSL